MIRANAKVVKVDADFAYLQIEKQVACDACGEKSVCGVSALSKLFGNRSSIFKLPNADDKLSADEMVSVGLSEKDLFKIAGRSYLVPIFGFLIFVLIGTFLNEYWSFSSEWLVVGFAILGLVLSPALFKTNTSNSPLVLLDNTSENEIKFVSRKINES